MFGHVEKFEMKISFESSQPEKFSMKSNWKVNETKTTNIQFSE